MSQRHESASRRRVPIDRLVAPFRVFAANQLSGAILLVIATALALLWANSRWASSYYHLLELPIDIEIGDYRLRKTLHHWINDGLMAFFFFVVGLEIKREVLAGELSSVRKAALPIVAALGGMVVPAGIYVLINWGGPALHGWGIPMATDIAFALGVITLVGSRAPLGLKIFLTALAIVDDIGAILVIAVFYTESLSIPALIAGALGLGVSIAANWSGVRNEIFYFIVGIFVWLAFLESGIHATLAAVLLAFTIPARIHLDRAPFLERMSCLMEEFRSSPAQPAGALLSPHQQHILDEVANTIEQGTAPLQRLEHSLMPFVNFAVLPVFALANAGVTLKAETLPSLFGPSGLGVLLGLFLGKQIGIFLFSWLAVKMHLADLPAGVNWLQLHAVAVMAGIGFTMSLFIAELAFSDKSLMDGARVAILGASALSATVGYVLLLRTSPKPS